MAVFKCKMCGGTLEFAPGDTVAVCDSCGTKQTLPKLDDQRRANLYDRANHFRRNNEFDKAMGIYEQILNEDKTDAEAYWSLVLCRYGIEYVEDPATHKRIPTVNRAQFTSIFDDDNYKSALQYADAAQRALYEQEAEAINEIQKGILAISQKEEPFDVFICYKETGSDGRRTRDSVLATELYHQLTGEGFKVFFSRITLEDKLGTAYEPYIFAALNSAKVMVVLGTKPEYFNAVWVKNEWSRYLALIKNGAKKVLIPAYRDMDPYDLPEEFSHLQAQDMSKLGFMQDLIRGIKKITAGSAPKAASAAAPAVGGIHIEPLLKRAFLFLEDGNWQEADAYCEKVLDQDPECAEAYLGKMMAELQVHKKEDLSSCFFTFENLDNYRKILRFADDKLKAEIAGYNAAIKERNERTLLEKAYKEAVGAMESAGDEAAYQQAAQQFDAISSYKDAGERAEQCRANAENCRKDAVYAQAKKLADEEGFTKNGKIPRLEDAIAKYESIPGWKDADEQILACRRRIEEIRVEEERMKEEACAIAAKRAARRKRNKIIATILTLVTCVVVVLSIILFIVTTDNRAYNHALALYESGQYKEAAAAFNDLGDYKDSTEKLNLIIDEHPDLEIYYRDVDVGDTIQFGDYHGANQWIILEKTGNKILVISKYCLDRQPYNTTVDDVTWETCSLRQWLNSTYLNEAFSEAEQAKIASTTISTPSNMDWTGQVDTTDKVFLLSIDEAEKYFETDNARRAEATAYVIENGPDYTQSTWNWWLRSPGQYEDFAMYVSSAGTIDERGSYVDMSIYFTVRPAMWINLTV